jgi:SAM-dependent methyltransferase
MGEKSSYTDRLLTRGIFATRLSHRRRFTTVINLLLGRKFSRALDYGCADGALLKRAFEMKIIKSGIGVDSSDDMLISARANCSNIATLQFCLPSDLSSHAGLRTIDLVICTETLEHVNSPADVLDSILPLCTSDARLLISVPIEIGPALVIKQAGRYLANLRGNYGYESYTLSELISGVVKSDVSTFPSSHTQADVSLRGHKGFDYRKLREVVARRVVIDREIYSPVSMLGRLFNSTVIWLGHINHNASRE